jgi:hypothetical protein
MANVGKISSLSKFIYKLPCVVAILSMLWQKKLIKRKKKSKIQIKSKPKKMAMALYHEEDMQFEA